jgi:hypothetical protein
MSLNIDARKLMMGIAGIVVFGLLFGFLVINNAPEIAQKLCDTKSMKSFIAASDDDHLTRDMEQQIAACKDEDLDKGDDALKNAIPGSGATATPTVTVTVTATPSATAKPAPPVHHWYDPFDPKAEQFYANWPAKMKSSVNAYGPDKPVNPALTGKDMEKLNADQAYAEHIYVIQRDRMQTASEMVYLGLSDKNVNTLTGDYVRDRKLWEHDKKLVLNKLKAMKRRVEDKPAGFAVSTLRALPGGDQPIVDQINVVYPTETRWIVYKDPKTGKEYWNRLKCKFQPRLFKSTHQIPMAPPTRPGIVRTPEGTPVPVVDVCRKVNGTWTKVYNVMKRRGDLPLNSSKCKPTHTTPPTSTPPTTKPPKHNCKETEYWNGKECVEKKDPGKLVDPPSNRPPAGAPDPNQGEDTPHADPTSPANPSTKPGSGTNDPAPGATSVPSQTAPAPTVTGAPATSTPGTTIGDPDGN